MRIHIRLLNSCAPITTEDKDPQGRSDHEGLKKRNKSLRDHVQQTPGGGPPPQR
jgi:hypothetical protein